MYLLQDSSHALATHKQKENAQYANTYPSIAEQQK